MKISFVFWNLRGAQTQTLAARQSALLESIARIAAQQIDVFIFAECPIDEAMMIGALSKIGGSRFYLVPSIGRRTLIFSRLMAAQWTDLYYDAIMERLSAQELQ